MAFVHGHSFSSCSWLWSVACEGASVSDRVFKHNALMKSLELTALDVLSSRIYLKLCLGIHCWMKVTQDYV